VANKIKGECSACHYEGDVYECSGNPSSKKFNLCGVCYNTPVGRIWQYHPHAERTEMFTTMAAIANYVLDEIRQSKE